MNEFYQEIEGIYRLKIPFDTVYTSVFLVEADGKTVMVDCATTAEDVDGYIVPALATRGYGLSEIDMLVLTHRHSDHAGGLERILQLAPNIEVVAEVRRLAAGVSTYPLTGHTADMIGLLDERTHTLISGDGLQGAGVDKYRCTVHVPEAYPETLARIENDPRIENILFSHAYEPWYQDHVFGRDGVLGCVRDCLQYVKKGETKK